MTFSPLDPLPRLTMEERWDTIQFLTDMIVADFGTQKGPYNPDDPGNRARHALLEISAAYLKFAEIDAIADSVLAPLGDGDPDIDLENVTLPR